MFKPTQCLHARLRLTTKQVNGGYYKGNRTGSMGFFGRNKGKYVIDWNKVRTYVAPEGLADFKLTPFVTKRMEPTKTQFTKTIMTGEREVIVPRAFNSKDFLNEWAEENPEEVDELKEKERRRRRAITRSRNRKAAQEPERKLRSAKRKPTRVAGQAARQEEPRAYKKEIKSNDGNRKNKSNDGDKTGLNES